MYISPLKMFDGLFSHLGGTNLGYTITIHVMFVVAMETNKGIK